MSNSSEKVEPAPNGSRRRWIIIASATAAAIVLVVVVIAVASAGGNGLTPTPSASAPASGAPTPRATATPTGGTTPTPTPTPTATAAPNAGEEVTTPIDSEPEVGGGLSAKITSIVAIQGSASQPGEVAGPAITVTVEFTNDSDAAIDLNSVVVNTDYGSDRTPAGELSEEGDTPISGEIAPHSTASGKYTFTIPDDQRNDVRISVFTSVDLPILVFSGPVPS